MKPLLFPPVDRLGRRHAPSGARRRSLSAAPTIPYSAFIAYSSVTAAREALMRVTALLRARGDRHRLQPMLWRCDQLDDPRWREMALRDAARADLLVLAFPDSAPLAVETEAWLTRLARCMRGTELTALVFTGDDEGWTISLRAELPRAMAVADRPAAAITPSQPEKIVEPATVVTARAA